jgi:hypothetical protein
MGIVTDRDVTAGKFAPEDLRSLGAAVREAAADVFLLNQFKYSNDLPERDWQPLVLVILRAARR